MKNILTYIYMTLAVAALGTTAVSCSSDEPSGNGGANGGAEQPSWILFDFSTRQTGLEWEPVTSGRGGSSIDPVMPESVGVWGYNDKATGGLSYSGVGEVFRNIEFYYKGEGATKYLQIEGLDTEWIDNNLWPYLKPMPWIVSTDTDPVNYKFYAYAPYVPFGKDGIEVEESSYGGLKYVNWYNIPRYSNIDYMSASTITCYQSKPRGQRNDWQTMSMVHLQSRVRFCFKLGERYSELRVIHLKSIEVINLLGQTFNLRIRFDDDGTGNYVPTYQWDRNPFSDAYGSQMLYNDDGEDYIELSAANRDVYTPMASLYVYPHDPLNALTFRATYDIYDITGQLLRENDSAVSTVELNLKASGSAGTRVLEPGYYYDVNIKVQPSFLYVLSDNDTTADGHVIFNPDTTE